MELAQLVLGVATPLLLLLIGLPIARRTKQIETEAWVSQKIVEMRLELFDEVGPLLNDLYCLSACVGHFREVEPPRAVAHKRTLDRIMRVNRPVFAPAVLAASGRFMAALFVTHVRPVAAAYRELVDAFAGDLVRVHAR